jgi:hypothetical protein
MSNTRVQCERATCFSIRRAIRFRSSSAKDNALPHPDGQVEPRFIRDALDNVDPVHHRSGRPVPVFDNENVPCPQDVDGAFQLDRPLNVLPDLTSRKILPALIVFKGSSLI